MNIFTSLPRVTLSSSMRKLRDPSDLDEASMSRVCRVEIGFST
jgi:hypothetical protein